MDFGDRIKKLRAEKGLTQEQFSQKLNISRQAVSNWENNRNLPDIEMLYEIAKLFNVSVDYLTQEHSDNEIRNIKRNGKMFLRNHS